MGREEEEENLEEERDGMGTTGFLQTSDLVVGMIDVEHISGRPCHSHGGQDKHTLLLLVTHAWELRHEFLLSTGSHSGLCSSPVASGLERSHEGGGATFLN